MILLATPGLRCIGVGKFSSVGGTFLWPYLRPAIFLGLLAPALRRRPNSSIYISTCTGVYSLMTDEKTKAGFRWSDLSVYTQSNRFSVLSSKLFFNPDGQNLIF